MDNFTLLRSFFAKITAFLSLILISFNISYGQQNTMEIVHEVQRNANSVYNFINTLSFSGKVKVYSYMGHNSMDVSMIPYLEEYWFEGFWMKPDSVRIVVKAYRKYTGEIFTGSGKSNRFRSSEIEYNQKLRGRYLLPNPMMFSYDESLVEPRVRERLLAHGVKNTMPVFPFALGADSIYNYRKISEVTLNGRKVIEIQTAPKSPETPGIIGIFRIDDEEKNIVDSEYRFNNAAKIKDADLADLKKKNRIIGSLISLEEDYFVESEKGLFHSIYWFPIEKKEEIYFTLWGFKGRISRVIEFHSYDVNPDIRIDEGANKSVEFKREPEFENTVFRESGELENLNNEEEKAIINSSEQYFNTLNMSWDLIDSEALADNIRQLKLAQYADVKALTTAEKLTDFAHYNRVEGLGINGKISFFNTVISNSAVGVRTGYGFSDKKLKWESSFLKYFDRTQKYFVEGRIYNKLGFEEDKIKFSETKNTISSLFIKEDYRDYYYTRGLSIGAGFRIRDNLSFKLSGYFREETNAERNTDFGLFNRGGEFRINPMIIEGRNNSLKVFLKYNGNNSGIGIEGEYTDKDNLKSDYSYKYVRTDLDLKIRSNRNSNLIINITAGISDGALPPQKWFDFGGKSMLNLNGNLRGVGYKAFTGDRMIKGIFELEIFRRFIFDPTEDIKDWDAFNKSMKLTLWAGAGWSRISQGNRDYVSYLNIPILAADKIYTEYGISIGDRLNIFRLDLIFNNMSDHPVLFSLNFIR
ncbi:DUF5686 family protein [candidate division KSB1 bacterium]